MPVPVTQEIRKPLLEAFRDQMPHSYVIGELFNIITGYIGEDPNEMSSGDKNILREHIKQARSDLKQHGLISSPSRNTYMITNLGIEVLDDDPVSIDDDYLARLRTRGTSETLAESELAVLPDSEGTDTEFEAEPELTGGEDIITEPEFVDSDTQTQTEVLEDTDGDLDLTGGEEEINTEYTPDENQVLESESDSNMIQELEGVELEDAAEGEDIMPAPEPENLETEPDNGSDSDLESEQESESGSESDFAIMESPEQESGEDSTSSSVRSLESVLEKFNEELANEILRRTAAIPSDKFEMLVIDLLSKMGYRAFQNARYTTEISGDDCIHGVILEEEPGLSPIYIQARKLSPAKKVSKQDVQEFVKALSDKGGKGLFATTASFSAQAVNYARSEKIMLIDGSRLANLMIANNFCVSVEKVFEIKSIDTESFGEYERQ